MAIAEHKHAAGLLAFHEQDRALWIARGGGNGAQCGRDMRRKIAKNPVVLERAKNAAFDNF